MNVQYGDEMLQVIPFSESGSIECVWGNTIRPMNTNQSAVLGANNAIALASSMNDPSIAFNQREIFVEIKLM